MIAWLFFIRKIEIVSKLKVKSSDHPQTMSASSILSNDNGNPEKFLTWAKHVKYTDGSIYRGNLDRYGNRTGFGILRSPITVFGVYDSRNTNTLLHWTEATGQWLNDKAHGFGITLIHRGDGTKSTIFEGVWQNGEPLEDRAKDECFAEIMKAYSKAATLSNSKTVRSSRLA
jgi:hypothetical protein